MKLYSTIDGSNSLLTPLNNLIGMKTKKRPGSPEELLNGPVISSKICPQIKSNAPTPGTILVIKRRISAKHFGSFEEGETDRLWQGLGSPLPNAGIVRVEVGLHSV